MKRIIFLAVFTYVLTQNVFTQHFDYGFSLGVNYGGPISNNKDTASKGKVYPGFSSGVFFVWKPFARFHFLTGLEYQRNVIDYSTFYRKDTNISQNIGSISLIVPTYYNAYVSGRMKYNYINLSLFAVYKWKKWHAILGGVVSGLAHIKDTAQVNVIIGEGGFFDDFTSIINRKKAYHIFESRISAGFSYELPAGFILELRCDRSLIPIWKKAYQTDVRGVTSKLFNTYVFLNLKWKLSEVLKQRRNN